MTLPEANSRRLWDGTSFLVSYALIHVSVVVVRRADPEGYDPEFEMPAPLYPAVPILGVVLSFVVISQMANTVLLIGTGIIGLSIVWYAIYVRNRVGDEQLVGDAIVGSGNGPGEPIDAYRIVVPIANPETQTELLRLAAASARTYADEETPEIVAVNVIQVPSQTALEQNLQFEEERVERQRDLFKSAREAAGELNVNLRTRAIVGRDIGRTILTVLEEEEADQVLLGWHGRRRTRDYVFGSTVDPIIRDAPCEVTVVNLKQQKIGNPVALAGPGPHAQVAARRAFEYAALQGTTPTLLNAQQPRENEEITDSRKRGELMIEDVAEAAGLEAGMFETEVVVSDDIESVILENIKKYDTVCVGVSERRAVSKILWGSLADRIVERAEGNVALVRGEYEIHRSIREGIVERLSD